MTTELSDLLDQFFDAMNAWDMDALRSCQHPDVVYEMPYAPEPFPRRLSGLAEVMKFYAAMPDFAVEENVQNLSIVALDAPGECLLQFNTQALLRNGNAYQNTYIVRCAFEDGLLRRYEAYFDPLVLIKAMGATVIMPESV